MTDPQMSYPAWLRACQRRERLRACAWAAAFLAIGIVIGAMLSGCATVGTSTAPVRDGQEQAVWIVWHAYGRDDMPPLIRWRQGSQLECDDPNSHKRGFYIVDVDPSGPDGPSPMKCREGLTWSGSEVIAAWHGETTFADTVMPHELRHAALLRAGIALGDPLHLRLDWIGDAIEGTCQPDSPPECGIVARAKTALLAAGR